MSKPVERVLVFGDDMRIFLAVVRSLGRAGKEVHAAPFNWHSPALQSKYVSAVHRLPRYSDDPNGWRASVISLAQKYNFDLIMPCCDDRAILPFDIHRNDFTKYRVAIPDPTSMQLLFDKQCTRELCAELDIPVAPGKQLAADDNACDLAARFNLPLVLKPRRSFWADRLDGWGKVFIVENENQLNKLLFEIEDRSRYLVEGYFKGVGVGVSVLSDHGKVLHAFQHRRLREGWGGSSSYRVSEAVNPTLYAACEKICRHTGLTGVCMFEFRWCPTTQEWILLETNARFWGSSPLPLSLGVDFPRYLFDLLVHDRRHAMIPYPSGIRSRNAVLDGMNLFKSIERLGSEDIGNWISEFGKFLLQPLFWLSGRELSDTFVRDDLRPAFAECAMLFKSIKEKIARAQNFVARRRQGERAGKSAVDNVTQEVDLLLEAGQPTPGERAMQPAVAAAVNVSLTTSLASLEREWRQFESTAACTPFQTYDWLSSWQRCVGAKAGVTPAIITARQHGKLLFILPLAAQRKGPVRLITFLGHTLCDYNAPLLASDFSAQVSDTQFRSLWNAARELLQRQFQYDVVVLDKMPEKIGRQANPMRSLGTSLHPSGAHAMALGENWEQFYSAKRSSATRRRDRTKRRKLAELGDLRFITAETPGEIRKTVDMLIEQKSRWFQRMGIRNLFEIPAQKEFFLSLATTARPLVHVSQLSIGPNCAAANLGLLFQGCYYHVLASHDDGPTLRFGAGVAHLHDLMRFAIERGCKSFDFTIGDEAYKRDWADSQFDLHDYVSGDGFLGRPAAAVIRVKLRAKRYIKNSPLVWSAVSKLRFMLGRRSVASS